jgi:hypothetical protein
MANLAGPLGYPCRGDQIPMGALKCGTQPVRHRCCPAFGSSLRADDFLHLFAYDSRMNLGLPMAWVVKCKKCGCTINCRAIDPQTEHSQPDKAAPPPQDSVIVTCSCCWAAYRYGPTEIFKGPPSPSSNCHDRRGLKSNEGKKPNAVLLIAASLIAAVRLNREEIKSSPIVYSKIADSIRLAEMIQARLRG